VIKFFRYIFIDHPVCLKLCNQRPREGKAKQHSTELHRKQQQQQNKNNKTKTNKKRQKQ